MKIIYVHHAMRDKGCPPSQQDGITNLGRQDAKIVSEILLDAKNRGMNIKGIYSSEFYRCMETARLINEHINVEIYNEPRFNEYRSVPNETWTALQNRIRNALHDIINKYEKDDAVICVTSGVNVVAFTSLAYKLKPSEDAPFIGIPSCSPLVFDIAEKNFV